MGSTNKFFKNELTGLGLDLYYQKQPFTATESEANTWTPESKALPNYTFDQDIIATSIFRYKKLDETGTNEANGISSQFVTSNISKSTDEFVNETSLIDIIKYLQGWSSTYVDYADFAYLKNLGVYPTNRLMIARRFSGPVHNNLFKIKEAPLATMISWIPDDMDFFNITFGENWEAIQEASFVSILNNVGEDMKGFGPKILGKAAAAGFNLFPQAGWTEGLQIEIAKRLGIVDKDGYDPLNPPLGNPNLIREAQRRTLVSKEQAGSGLNSSFSIKFVVEYEQKFINGIDPSLVYMDIIQKALVFGTSKSVFMFNSNFESNTNDFIKKLVSGEASAVGEALKNFADALKDAIIQVLKDLKKDLEANKKSGTDDENKIDLIQTTFGSVISKYKVKLLAVVHALTGAPSSYWHVTLGNPKKPFFCSGDLVTTNVSLTFGKVLSFNDLPSSIKIEFTLNPARTLGGDEIMDRFNTGRGRTYFQRRRPYLENFTQDSNGTQTRYDNFKKSLEDSKNEIQPKRQ